MSRTVCSAPVVERIDFCLIFVPFGHYDEPEILRYENSSICPIGADVRHFDEYKKSVAKYTLDYASKLSGVPKEQLLKLAKVYADPNKKVSSY